MLPPFFRDSEKQEIGPTTMSGTSRTLRSSNRHAFLRTLLRGTPMARSDVADATGLSTSTVSSIATELLEDGTLVETGTAARTRGRPKVLLALNDALGTILTVRVRRQGVSLVRFSLALEADQEQRLCDFLPDGNRIHDLITEAVRSAQSDTLAIGLVLEDDLRSSDVAVMFSTTLSADSIGLADLLRAELRVPVMIERVGHLIATSDVLARTLTPVERENHVLVQEASASAVLVQHGRPFPLASPTVVDLRPAEAFLADRAPAGSGEADRAPALLQALFILISYFPVAAAVIQSETWAGATAMHLEDHWRRMPWAGEPPRIVVISSPDPLARLRLLASRAREQALLTP
ncbi:hypothetical protein OHJ16_16090 [Actinomyces israelii]|uniref:ROK family transcriptional regulator n=1 Tax=Actinomyces israelii TaxID=1659 RepID=A0ABT4ICS6_9ACTO|nr:hypothetical protein [Actinomyces israelii]MCZ0859552.1 hypothetical protein [Actinomyces israelii]